ncbi:hypothetical protein ABKN59_009074 [Abortiporus biennis]
MARHTTDFPEDIIYLILDLLNFDKQTLSACSLVSKQWTIPCQQYLFKSLCITNIEKFGDDRDHDIKRFSNFVTNNHKICPYIRHLMLQAKPQLSISALSIKTSTLLLVLNQLPGLSSFVLSQLHVNFNTEQVLQVKYEIDAVHLDRIKPMNKIFFLLSLFPAINNLTIISSDFYNCCRDLSFPHLRIKHLDIKDATRSDLLISGLLQIPETVESLEVIHARITHLNVLNLLGQLLDKTATHIIDLQLLFSPENMNPSNKYNDLNFANQLKKCSSLRIAQFDIGIMDFKSRSGTDLHHGLFDYIIELVSHIPITVNELKIGVIYRGRHPLNQVLERLDWQKLSNIISKRKLPLLVISISSTVSLDTSRKEKTGIIHAVKVPREGLDNLLDWLIENIPPTVDGMSRMVQRRASYGPGVW